MGDSTTDLRNQNSRSPQKMHVCKAGTVEMLQAETVLGGVALSVLIYNAWLATPKLKYKSKSPWAQVLTLLLDTSANQIPAFLVTYREYWSVHCGQTHRIKGTRRSFMACRAANSPCSSHHLLASNWNLLTSSGSTVAWEDGRTLSMAKENKNKSSA